jgi:hypothetical protein
VLFIYLRTNSDFCPIHQKPIDFYNRDEKCLLRGTKLVFKNKAVYASNLKGKKSMQTENSIKKFYRVYGP